MAPKRYQGSDEWHEERKSGYGASDAPILVEGDEERWHQLHGEKLGILPRREPNETMEIGLRVESVILEMAAERSGQPIVRVNRPIRHPDLPYVYASLDGRYKRSPRRPVEAKKYGFKNGDFGPEGSDTVPTGWLYQVQQQMAVTGADAVDIWTLFGGAKLERFTVGRDDVIIAEILGLETAAWAFVMRGEMPPWPGQAPKRVILAADEVEVDEALAILTLSHDEAARAAKDVDEALDTYKDAIRERLADHAGAKGVLPDGRRVTIAYRPQADRETVAWELVAKVYRAAIESDDMTIAEHLDDVESMFTTTKPGIRPLRITIGKDTK